MWNVWHASSCLRFVTSDKQVTSSNLRITSSNQVRAQLCKFEDQKYELEHQRHYPIRRLKAQIWRLYEQVKRKKASSTSKINL